MVRADTTLTFDIEGTTGGWLPIDDTDLRSGVANALTPFVDVLEVAITRGSFLANVIDVQWWHWNYRAVVTLRTRSAYADADDIRSVVAGVFYQAAGAMPSVTVRSFGEAQGAGVTQTSAPAVRAFLNALTGTGVLLLVAVVGLVWIVAYGPNVGSVARAVRA